MNEVEELKGCLIRAYPELSRGRHCFVKSNGEIRLSDSFLRELSISLSGQGFEDAEIKPSEATSCPKVVEDVKGLYNAVMSRQKGYERILANLSVELARVFREEVFQKAGEQHPTKANHIINKPKSGRMSVSSFTAEGQIALANVVMIPSVDWGRLIDSTRFAYTKGIDMGTGTISNYFKFGKWESYYNEYDKMGDGHSDPRNE